MAGRTIQQKCGDWKQAFDVVREELTTETSRSVLRTMQTRPPGEDESEATYLRTQVAIAQAVAGIIAANDRQAALVAAMLTGAGVKTPVEYEE